MRHGISITGGARRLASDISPAFSHAAIAERYDAASGAMPPPPPPTPRAISISDSSPHAAFHSPAFSIADKTCGADMSERRRRRERCGSGVLMREWGVAVHRSADERRGGGGICGERCAAAHVASFRRVRATREREAVFATQRPVLLRRPRDVRRVTRDARRATARSAPHRIVVGARRRGASELALSEQGECALPEPDALARDEPRREARGVGPQPARRVAELGEQLARERATVTPLRGEPRPPSLRAASPRPTSSVSSHRPLAAHAAIAARNAPRSRVTPRARISSKSASAGAHCFAAPHASIAAV